MYFDEFKHQLPDIDESETDDWMTSLDQVVDFAAAKSPLLRRVSRSLTCAA